MTLHLQYRNPKSRSELDLNIFNRNHFSSSSSSNSFHSSHQVDSTKMISTITTTLTSSNMASINSHKVSDERPRNCRLAILQANQSNSKKDSQRFESFSDSFYDLLGSRPQLRRLLKTKDGKQFFHEAGIYLRDSDSIILSTNRFVKPDNHYDQHIGIVQIPLKALPQTTNDSTIYPSDPNPSQQSKMWNEIKIREQDLGEHLIMPNGATRWPLSDGHDGILWCEQGKHDLDQCQSEKHSALVIYCPYSFSTKSVLDSFQGKRFKSLNDVIIHPTSKTVFFTDPDYGLEQLFKLPYEKQKDYAPKGVYCWQPKTGEVILLDEDYHKPNGCTFVPDPNAPKDSGCGALITTDTGRLRFDHSQCPISGKTFAKFVEDNSKPACIYAYPVNYGKQQQTGEQNCIPFVDVSKRQLVANSTCGAPDGIHYDEKGNIWAGHGDGVHAYSIDWESLSKANKKNNENPIGKLIGKIRLPNNHGVANFCWAGSVGGGDLGEERYRMLLFAEDELWEAIVAVNGFD